MNRYTYRGKRTDNGDWVYGNLIQCGITGKAYLFPIGSDANESDRVGEEGCLRLVAYEIDPRTLGQCTGFPAKKTYRGPEPEDLLIFEGDMDSRGYVVVWDFDRFLLVDSEGLRWGLHTDCEIVSTYHDNPELWRATP